MRTSVVFIALLLLVFGPYPQALADDTPEDSDVQQEQEDKMLELHGSVEAELRSEEGFDEVDGDNGGTSTNTDLTVDLEAVVSPSDWINGTLAVSWDDEDGLDFEEVYLTLGNPVMIPVFLSAGKMTLPFGLYETAMVSDPLTQDIGEVRSQAVALGLDKDGWDAAVFLYNGKTADGDEGDSLRSWGANVSYSWEKDDRSLLLGTSWIENMADAIGLRDYIHDENLTLQHRVPGIAPYFIATLADWTLSLAYVTALQRPEFLDEDELEKTDRPQAWSAEVDYQFELFETMDGIIAFAYSRSEGAGDILPKKRIGSALTIMPVDFIHLSLEYLREFDYSESDGGTGDQADIFTVQVAVGF